MPMKGRLVVASLATKLGSHLDMCTCARADGPLSNVGEPRMQLGTMGTGSS